MQEVEKMKETIGKEIIDFLDKKWNGARCPLCGEGDWSVADKIFEIRDFNDRNLVLGGPKNAVMPVIPVTCANCGNTILINALTTGLLKE